MPSFREALWVWLKIGCLGFGGPAGQIALMHRVLVDEKKWVEEQRYLHALNFCMLLPGPEAQKLATYVGWLLHGVRGGLVAGILFVLPGALVMLAVSLLYVVRRYAGKLLYELELHGDVELESMRRHYVELLADATKIEPSPTDYLADVDEGFYCTCYLRAWAFHTQIESYLREELGRSWFTRPEAGSLLRELWAEGQRLTAAELLDQVAGAKLELAAVGERIGEEVRA